MTQDKANITSDVEPDEEIQRLRDENQMLRDKLHRIGELNLMAIGLLHLMERDHAELTAALQKLQRFVEKWV